MSFIEKDAAAIAATLTGPIKVKQLECSAGLLAHVHVTGTGRLQKPSIYLAEVIEACQRWGKDGMETTVWVDVEHAELLPIVQQAAERLVGFGVGLFVSCEGKCSHKPGKLLSDELRLAIARAQRDGTLWHALAGRPVPAEPEFH